MNDPHVVAVYCRIVPGDFVEYIPPKEPVTHRVGDFAITVEALQIKIKPLSHYSSREEVLATLAPLLEGWQLETALRHRLPELRFEYERPDICDRNPRSGTISVTGELRGRGMLKANAVLVKRVDEHPLSQVLVSPLPLMSRLCGVAMSVFSKGVNPSSRWDALSTLC